MLLFSWRNFTPFLLYDYKTSAVFVNSKFLFQSNTVKASTLCVCVYDLCTDVYDNDVGISDMADTLCGYGQYPTGKAAFVADTYDITTIGEEKPERVVPPHILHHQQGERFLGWNAI